METNNRELIVKTNEIEIALKNIKKLQQTTNKPIFIELLGTPKSGKTTLKKSLSTLFENSGINYLARKETAEYNPMDKSANGYNLWMVLELLKNVDEDLSKKQGQIIIYDRGIFDRIPWMKYDVRNGDMKKEDEQAVIQLYNGDIIGKYTPISKIFITSPQISIERKGRTGKFVNTDSINTYNSILQSQISKIMEMSSYSDLTITDKYQGDIKGFVIDGTYSIITEINRELEERIKEGQQSNERIII